MQTTSREPTFGRVQTGALVVGAVGVVGAILTAWLGGEHFFQSYLYAFLFWLGLSLGCFVLLVVQHMAGGSWGAMIRRPLEAGVALLPLMLLLFVPLLFGLGDLYEWTHAEAVAESPIVAAKTSYLNVPFFVLRAVLYFAIWIGGAFLFLRASRRQDEAPADSGRIGYRLKRASGLWIVLYVLTMTFAAVDWGMSLTPEWFSGMYPVILMIGQAISSIAFIIAVIVLLARVSPAIDELLTPKRLQDLGNFLMAFTMFWAYVSFSQIIIIWSNNVIETNPYYVLRFNTGWGWAMAFLLVFGFFAPFAILFSRWVKQKRRALVAVAVWAIVVRFVDLFVILAPAYERPGFPLQWADVLLTLGLGGLWIGAFFWTLARRPLLPQHDPRLVKAAHHA